jgi:hypothetical protein
MVVSHPMLPKVSEQATAREVAGFAAAVTKNFDRPISLTRVTAAAEAANVRRVTVQVIDRNGISRSGRHSLLLWITDTAGGMPVTTQTVALVSGDAIMTIDVDGTYEIITDSDGKVVFDVTIAGAATRYIETAVRNPVEESVPLVWT